MSRVSGSSQGWERVAVAVIARRRDLGLSKAAALRRTYPRISRSVWDEIEKGDQESYAEISVTAIARALQWSSDSIERILRGDQPIQPDDDLPVIVDVEVSRQLKDLQQAVRELRDLVESMHDHMLGEDAP